MLISSLCINQDVSFSLIFIQTTVACVRQTVDECWVVTIDQRSGGCRSPASSQASFGSIQLKFALCRSGRCWILISSSNFRRIDFFTEGCFCLHKYWIDFKQRRSSICPWVNVESFWERSTKNRLRTRCCFCFIFFYLFIFSMRMQGHGNINTGTAKGLDYSEICNCKIKDNWVAHRRKSDKSSNN